jgi:broad specificity phosphatase PhoE
VIRLTLMRHGRTPWNEAGRIQGQTDTPLSAAGRAQVAAWRVPARVAASTWYVSPLARARETAALLGQLSPITDERLIEMSFGEYEGCRLTDLRNVLGAALADNEIRGLDFQPPGGETPRKVAARFSTFLRDVAGAGKDLAVVAHKGILRASVVLAFGWDMLGKSPVPVVDDAALEYFLDRDGRLTFERSLPLLPVTP